MTFFLRQRTLPLLLAASALGLSACVSIGGKAPPFMLTLSAESSPAANLERTAKDQTTLTILTPSAPQKLRTPRIPVQKDDASIAYITEGQWVEAPQRLFQRLLSETTLARTNRVVLDEAQYLTAPGEQLAGQLLDFGVDARSKEAIVVYEAMLVNNAGKTVTKRRFEAREPLTGKIEARNAGVGLQRAANRVAVEVADWIGSTPAA